ncbi:unnamed protein product [Mesocestoides corti]|uniref:Ras-GAP domain-containing protein n=1 Tax=Mesocestoides corti TaxID=53468 RepID=A0A0R3U240_MESCO|nr:unnamed protein product [Mesocestoides corti]
MMSIDDYIESRYDWSDIEEARQVHSIKARSDFRAFTKRVQKQANNAILDHLWSVDGFPLSAFLSRVGLVPKFTSSRQESTFKLIEEALHKLNGDLTNGRKTTLTEKAGCLSTLCKLAATEEMDREFSDWMRYNSARLNGAVSTCLILECQDVAQEACFALAYLARKFHFLMKPGIGNVFESLMHLMDRAMSPRQRNFDAFWEAKRRHEDGQVYKILRTTFHPPPPRYCYSEIYYRLVGVIYYTVADLLYNIPHPDLINFFVSRISRHHDLTRQLFFQILDAVVINLSEMQEEAQNFDTLSTDDPQDEMYNENLWRQLPILLYINVLKTSNETYIVDSEVPDTILNILGSKLTRMNPFFDEKILQMLDNHLTNAKTVNEAIGWLSHFLPFLSNTGTPKL